MQEMIDIIDFLDHIYVDMEQFIRFQRRCHLDEMDCTEIIQQVIRQTIADKGHSLRKNALIEQSSRCNLVQTADAEKVLVALPAVKAKKDHWIKFSHLPISVQTTIVSQLIADGLEDLFDRNPSLLNYYLSKS